MVNRAPIRIKGRRGISGWQGPARMDIAGVIRRALEAKGWSQARLAKEVGVSRQTVSAWLRGEAAPNRKRAPAVAIALNIPLSSISGDPGNINVSQIDNDQLRISRIPLVDWVSAGRGAEAVASYAFDGTHEFVEPTFQVSSQAFALEVRGDSMEPDFRSGDVIIVDPAIGPITGYFVIAELLSNEATPGSGEVTFKQYRPRAVIEGVHVFDLVPLNASYPTVTVNAANPGRVVGVVVEHKRNLLR